MIVYYDLVADKEVASDSFDEKPVDGFKGMRQIQGKKVTFKEDIKLAGSNASKGDGEAGEDGDADEGVDEPTELQVINVVHAAKLQKMELSAKEYGSIQKKYWKKLLDKLNEQKYKALGIRISEEDDKDSIKEKETAALAELSKFEMKGVDDAKAAIQNFKDAFEDYQKFVKEVIVANYAEFEFYTCEEGELGECLLIPARYVGEAEAPVFYFFDAALKFKKE